MTDAQPAELKLDALFPQPELSLWREAAENALNGADFEKTLYSQTLEGITLQPLYHNNPQTLPTQPGQGDGRRGRGAGWQIQQAYVPGPDVLKQLQADSEQGLEAWSIKADALDEETLTALVQVTKTPVYLQTQHPERLLSWAKSTQPAALLCDPVGNWVTAQSAQPEAQWDETAACLKALPQSLCLEVSGLPYHEAGAHVVQELSAVLAALVESLSYLEEQHGIAPAQSLKQSRVTLASDSQFFMNVAKFRASHILLKRLSEVYESTDYPQIHARTSQRELTHLDIHSNYLRQSIGALAAVLGNCESLTTGAYDELSAKPSAAGRRQARNLQLLLKHEVHLDQLADPGGGAYFIENLTQALAEASWHAFQQIETQGGLCKQLKTGQLQQEIQKIAQERILQIQKRKQVLVGTNMYANPQEKIKISAEPQQPQNHTIQSLTPLRLAAEYEVLRQAAQGLKVLLLNIGSAKGSRPRQDFARGVFEILGAEVTGSEVLTSCAEAVETAQNSEAQILVCCGSDGDYQSWITELAPALKQAQRPLVVAGRGGERETEWREAGVDAFIYLGANILKTLETVCSGL